MSGQKSLETHRSPRKSLLLRSLTACSASCTHGQATVSGGQRGRWRAPLPCGGERTATHAEVVVLEEGEPGHDADVDQAPDRPKELLKVGAGRRLRDAPNVQTTATHCARGGAGRGKVSLRARVQPLPVCARTHSLLRRDGSVGARAFLLLRPPSTSTRLHVCCAAVLCGLCCASTQCNPLCRAGPVSCGQDPVSCSLSARMLLPARESPP